MYNLATFHRLKRIKHGDCRYLAVPMHGFQLESRISDKSIVQKGLMRTMIISRSK